MVSRKFTYEYINDFFISKNCELLSENYISSQEKLLFKCSCGNNGSKSFSEFQRSSQCKKCGNNGTKEGLKLKYADVYKYYAENNCTLLSVDYVNSRTKMSFMCECGNIHESRFEAFKNSPRCSDCGREIGNEKTKLSYTYVKDFFTDNGCILLSDEYDNSKSKLNFICECGEENVTTFGAFKTGTRCWQCGIRKNIERMKLSIEYINNVFLERQCTLLTTEYKNKDQLLNFLCACGNEGDVRLHDFINGNRCKTCVKKNRSESRIGRKFPNNSGANHPQWDSSKTVEEREKGRFITEYKQCRLEVYKRDKFTCQCCGDSKGGNLVAHHIDGWDWCKDRRFELDNIITLCNLCHDDFHNFYGFGNNTSEQWEEYLSELYVEIV